MTAVSDRIRQALFGTLVRVDSAERVVALTFDDGPDPGFTPRVLDILARHRARATFFLIGVRAAAASNLVKRIGDEGHAIGNHSWDHPKFTAIPAGERRRQITDARRVLGPPSQRLFRPPYGCQSVATRMSLLPLRYLHVGWNVDIEDWLPHSAEHFAESLTRRLRPGCIVLLHDSLYRPRAPAATDRGPLFAALDRVLERSSGDYRFVTVPEMLRLGRPRMRIRMHDEHLEWTSDPDGSHAWADRPLGTDPARPARADTPSWSSPDGDAKESA
jgi:peptidoglycan/xylan/chitin deacetylase (PgdA/CDA1 family)